VIDAAPLAWLAAKGIAVAALPLAYVWSSRDPAKFRKLSWLTAFLTLDLIMFGSFTRLADAGLGCPDWPGCYGHSNPLSADEHIRAAETALPSGPVTVVKAWIEMLHRYFAMGVGFLIIVVTIQAWRACRRSPSPQTIRLRNLSMSALVWVCIQGAFGAWTVRMQLQPAIVTLHLLGGMFLLSLLVALSLAQERVLQVTASSRYLRSLAAFALSAVAIQVALGGWVSSNYAVMACPDFPLCQGRVWPSMNISDGFTFWRPLGRTGEGAIIPFQALVAIHWVHRVFALVVVAIVALLAWRAWSIEGLARPARWLAGVLLLQLLTGMSNVILQWPLAAAVLHNGGAAVLIAVLVAVNLRTMPVSR
jgi:cytochrome c oxidase assembly protein subunit 15